MGFPDELKFRLRNIHTYVVTPFRADDLLQVDTDALRSNLQFLVERGVRVVAMGGGTGEFEALRPAEQLLIARTALETVGDRALVVATVPANLAEAVDLLAEYEKAGIEVVLAMPPLIRGQIPDDLGDVVEYYRVLCSHAALPVMPYNTQRWPVEIFRRLGEIEGLVAIKDPCISPHNLFRAIKEMGDRFVWIGNKRHDPGVLHLRYQMGIEAFTSGQSNYWPEPELELHEAAQRRDWDRMVELQAVCESLEKQRALSDDAAAVKAGVDLVGLHGGAVRPPRRGISGAEREQMAQLFAEMGVPGAGA